jgi:hypothetical protein
MHNHIGLDFLNQSIRRFLVLDIMDDEFDD